jgi:hypothetical protein
MAKCDECGIDEQGLSIHDALDALRSFPRRYTEAVAEMDDESLRRRPTPDVWSALEYLVHVREVLELLAMTVPLVLETPGLALPEIDAEDAAATRPDWVLNRDLALDGIGTACAQLVEHGAQQRPEAWSRPFTLGPTSHDAGWLVRHAAHEGAHHLRDVARVRAAVT